MMQYLKASSESSNTFTVLSLFQTLMAQKILEAVFPDKKIINAYAAHT